MHGVRLASFATLMSYVSRIIIIHEPPLSILDSLRMHMASPVYNFSELMSLSTARNLAKLLLRYPLYEPLQTGKDLMYVLVVDCFQLRLPD